MGTQRSTGTAMALAVVLAAANGLAADEASTDADGTDAYQDGWGPVVGDALPTIAAEDQYGDVRDLTSLSGARGLVLVVSRSAVW